MRRTSTSLWVSAACALLVAASAAGCSRTTTAKARVVYPAAVPVRAFPRVWVTGGHLEHEVRVIRALVDHLRQTGRASIERVELDDLEPRRKAGMIPPATVVLMVEVDFDEQTRPEWLTRPETVCGPVGCYTRNRSYMYDVPTVRGKLTLTVYEGPSARVLQRVSVDAEVEGRRYDRIRDRVVRRLIGRVREMVDRREELVDVELLDVEVPQVQRALELLKRGQWRRGRKQLEAAARTDAVRDLPPEQRARVLYDLSVARRFDATTMSDVEEHFRAAERPLRRAMRLDSTPRYTRALRHLQEHREQVETVREQEEAEEHNYRIGRLKRGVPPPPPSYDRR